MIRNGFLRKDGKFLTKNTQLQKLTASEEEDIEYRFLYRNNDLANICKTSKCSEFVAKRQRKGITSPIYPDVPTHTLQNVYYSTTTNIQRKAIE